MKRYANNFGIINNALNNALADIFFWFSECQSSRGYIHAGVVEKTVLGV